MAVRAPALPRRFREREHLRGEGAVARAERALAARCGAEWCLLVSSATNGLLALAAALDLRGADLLVPPHSYGATFGVFTFFGNRLIPLGARRDGNLDPRTLPERPTPRTRAVLATDFRGKPHDIGAVRRFCDRHGLLYLSDAAASFGRSCRGRPASSLADAWVLSFGPGKPLCAGEGGAILCHDAALYERLLRLTQHPNRIAREFSPRAGDGTPWLNARIHPAAARALARQLCSPRQALRRRPRGSARKLAGSTGRRISSGPTAVPSTIRSP